VGGADLFSAVPHGLGQGRFFNWALGGKIPVLDFAGGTVVHISSGVSALVFAIMLGKRAGFPREPMAPHNVVLSLVGTGFCGSAGLVSTPAAR
jgi:Amt family ammonium transporter